MQTELWKNYGNSITLYFELGLLNPAHSTGSITYPKIPQTRLVFLLFTPTANLKETKAIRKWGEALVVVKRTSETSMAEL